MKPRMFGLIGKGISHSMSPALFNAAYPGKGYEYVLIDCTSLDEGIAMARKKGIEAANVTTPFKEDAYLAAGTHDPISEKIKSANLLDFRNWTIKSFNTDYHGVYLTLSGICKSMQGIKTAIIGCGGAGKAAALACRDLGAELTIANRTLAKAEDLCRITGGKAVGLEKIEETVKNCRILIYAASQKIQAIENIDLKNKIIFEANYKDPALGNADCKLYIPGIKWLINQAIPSFEIFTGITPSLERMTSSPYFLRFITE